MNQGPYYVPSGSTPGATYEGDDGTPAAVTYFRVYAGIMAALQGLVMLLGLLFMVAPALFPSSFSSSSGSADVGAAVLGFIYAMVGFVFLVPWLFALFGGRRPWVHTLGTVLIAFSMMQLCCLPVTIPLIIAWTKPETRRWFGA